MGEMTMRERILAVIKGGRPDRAPFVQYSDLAAPNEEIWSEIGRENLGILRWVRIYRLAHPNCGLHTEAIERDGLKGHRIRIETPGGVMTEERLLEPTFGTASIVKHFVTEADDYDALCAYLEDSVVVEDLAEFHRADDELGDDGLPLVRVERTPFQQLWIQWVGIQDLALHLVDCPERVARCVAAMVREARQAFEIVARTPVPFVNFPDNITAPVIGEANFLTYCIPLYREFAQRLAGKDIPILVHMDGDLKPLWKAIDTSGINGLDSLSPPPDNDTSVADAVSRWPDMCVLVNFPSSVHLKSPAEIYDQAGQILQQGAHTGRLQIQISENMPPGAWRKSFPEIIRAIRDFRKGA